ncbi:MULTISPECIES: DDE-type integrase/transposase/recombinase [Rhizobium/Agrobacterium group]|uniref:DDE-type integrase/transposase/recombinase n=1 Tax=Rhizobium/Agrobacterium group TaxID=227290 RepID=UPI000AD554DE|nr:MULTISPECIES: DDE-type integrase/transposase/recombinase [Rhizobium/Agrobacterium group]
MTEAAHIDFRRHRFPAEIIAHAVWLYDLFPLSLRDVEDLLAERGINVSFQTVSEWAGKFGLKFAHQLRRRSRGHFADKWHLDEMVVSIKGKILAVACRRCQRLRSRCSATKPQKQESRSSADAQTAEGPGRHARVMVTDKLGSYSAAKRQLMPGIEHRSHKGLNNGVGNSHLPVRRRERHMMRFKPAWQCQRFVSTHGQIANLFHLHRQHLTAADHRELRAHASTTWREIALSIKA